MTRGWRHGLLLPVLLPMLLGLLPTGTDVDYQLGGVRPVPDRVGIVVRDREAAPVAGVYNVCYVNGFQTQPNERRFWRDRMRLVLHRHGKPVVDEAWGEWLLDVRTREKRARLARIVGRWVDGCADDGFDAVEFDNLDAFSRSHRLISRRQATTFARLLVRGAHDAGLEAAQKNLAGYDGTRIDFDFAVAEECGRYRECASYTRRYGDRVLAVEYRRADFRWTCARFGDRLAVVLRDRDLTPRGVRAWC
ncbi:MAG: endo alpha-1,4 polygalactosaminidase [Nocardioides sp.]